MKRILLAVLIAMILTLPGVLEASQPPNPLPEYWCKLFLYFFRGKWSFSGYSISTAKVEQSGNLGLKSPLVVKLVAGKPMFSRGDLISRAKAQLVPWIETHFNRLGMEFKVADGAELTLEVEELCGQMPPQDTRPGMITWPGIAILNLRQKDFNLRITTLGKRVILGSDAHVMAWAPNTLLDVSSDAAEKLAYLVAQKEPPHCYKIEWLKPWGSGADKEPIPLWGSHCPKETKEMNGPEWVKLDLRLYTFEELLEEARKYLTPSTQPSPSPTSEPGNR